MWGWEAGASHQGAQNAGWSCLVRPPGSSLPLGVQGSLKPGVDQLARTECVLRADAGNRVGPRQGVAPEAGGSEHVVLRGVHAEAGWPCARVAGGGVLATLGAGLLSQVP